MWLKQFKVLLVVVKYCLAKGTSVLFEDSEDNFGPAIQDMLLLEPNKSVIIMNDEINVPGRLFTSILNQETKSNITYFVFTNPILLKNIKIVSEENIVVILIFNTCTHFEFHLLTFVKKYCNKCFIILALRYIKCFDSLKNHMIQKELFNIYILKSLPKSNEYFIYEMCAFCNNGKHELKLSNIWYRKRGFKTKFTLEPSFKGNFYGAQLKVGLEIRKPFVFKIGESKSGLPIYGGEEYWLLDTLAKYLRFTPVLVEPSGFSCVNPYTRTITGFCRMLMKNQVQMAGFPYAMSSRFYKFFDPTAIYREGTVCIISVRPPVKKEWNSLLKSLQASIFLGIFVTLFLVSVVVWIGYKNYSINGDIFQQSFFDSFGILCLEAIRCKNEKFSKQIVFGFWMISCFFVISVVFGTITSIAASPGISKDLINSLDDIDKYELFWIRVPYFTVDNFVRKKFPERIPHIKKLDEPEALAYIQEYPEKYVFIHVKEMVEYYIPHKDRQRVFHISPQLAQSYKYLITILQRKDSYYTETITKKLLKVEAAGLLKGKFLPDTNRLISRNIDEIPVKENENVLFSIDNMVAILLLDCMLLFVAFIVFLLEVCWHRIRMYKNDNSYIGRNLRKNLNYISTLVYNVLVINTNSTFQTEKYLK